MSDFIKSAENFVRSELNSERRFSGDCSKDAIRVPLMDISNSGADIHSFPAVIKPNQQFNPSIDPHSEVCGFAAGSMASVHVNQVKTDQICQGYVNSNAHDAMESTDLSNQSSMVNFTESNTQIEAAIIAFVDGTCTDPDFMHQMKTYIAQNILDPEFEARYGKLLRSKTNLSRSGFACKRDASELGANNQDEASLNDDEFKSDDVCMQPVNENRCKKVHITEFVHDDVQLQKLNAVKDEIEFEKFKTEFNKAKSPLQVLNSGFSVGIESDIVNVSPTAAIETMPMKDKVSIKAMKKRIEAAWKQDKKKQPLLKKSTNLFTNSVQKSWSQTPHVKNVSFTTTGEGIKIDVVMDEVKSDEKPPGSYANAVSGQKRVDYTKLIDPIVFCPPKILETGEKVAVIQPCFIEKAKHESKTQLYGYFVGLELSLKFVRTNLYKMWRKFGITSIGTNGMGVFFFKFKTEEGLNEVLKLGPWGVDGVPLCLHKWKVGAKMTKIEPENIPIWTTFTNLPIELWNTACICQLASCIGKPLVFDNVTAEKCVKPNGIAGFARVLIEINARDQLLEKVRAIYPSDGSGGEESVFVNVKYQQHPPKCVHCHVFGHSLIDCKKKPFAEKDHGPSQPEKHSDDDQCNVKPHVMKDEFQYVGRNGKPVRTGVVTNTTAINRKSMNANANLNKNKQGYRVVENNSKKNGVFVSVETMNPFGSLDDDISTHNMVEEMNFKSVDSPYPAKPHPAKQSPTSSPHPAKLSPSSPHPAKQSPPSSPSDHPANPPPSSPQPTKHAREINRAGLNLRSKVCEVVNGNSWIWPDGWNIKFPMLYLHGPPEIKPEIKDRVYWLTNRGKRVIFSIKTAFEDLSVTQPDVDWRKIVWYSQGIPSHMYILWLAIRQRLLTQDRLMRWDSSKSLICSLCKAQPDSHEHLFFKCDFSVQVWNKLKDIAKLQDYPNALEDCVKKLERTNVPKRFQSILQRLMLAAMTYFIWQERNLRLFQQRHRTDEEVSMHIKQVVRMRLMGLTIYETPSTILESKVWGFHVHPKKHNSIPVG
ncbi:hypothetical protein QVD17_29551 [Tagetes erecta]|uniref:DUF4283 domain-containing protein n=1 Tax=Tagetes erecta TaxID=13708 RepID=A0AAD8K671_TARER|nr:hypothetical protein QVD17_29551 [Tagetes erecta]